MSADWKSLLKMAEGEVKAVITALPTDLRCEAERLPVVYDSRRSEDLRHLDLDDTLGLFVGASRLDGIQESGDLAPHIILFLENLWEFADGDEAIYREEVQTTYRHELGHYFGFEETDLEERGLQ